jgi:hypothetical protein
MIQILSIFAIFFALANTICIAMTLDQLEKYPLSPSSSTYAESPETIRPFKWNSPKEPVDLESFLGSGRYASYFSTSINLSSSFSQEPKLKESTTVVEAFVERHFSKNPIAQGTRVQSRINARKTVKTRDSEQNKKRSSNQPSIASFFKKARIEDSNNDGEVLTDRD